MKTKQDVNWVSLIWRIRSADDTPLTLDEFRAMFPRCAPYSPPWAKRFVDSRGRPVNYARQQISYRTAHNTREEFAITQYKKYLECFEIEIARFQKVPTARS